MLNKKFFIPGSFPIPGRFAETTEIIDIEVDNTFLGGFTPGRQYPIENQLIPLANTGTPLENEPGTVINSFWFGTYGEQKIIYVDWDDGQIETYRTTGAETDVFAHLYPSTSGPYNIKIYALTYPGQFPANPPAVYSLSLEPTFTAKKVIFNGDRYNGRKATYRRLCFDTSAVSAGSVIEFEGVETNAEIYFQNGNLERCFRNCIFSEETDLSNWYTEGVTNMSAMFQDAEMANVTGIEDWVVSSVTDMSSMFQVTLVGVTSGFNLDIGNWQVGNVTDMSRMFSKASSFNQDISGWNVSKVTDMSYMFANAGAFNQNINSWDVGSVTNMTNMFNTAVSFNQDLNSWNVSGVLNMSAMFFNAFNFNGYIANWNTLSVRDMSSMFTGALKFNQPINTWDIRGLIWNDLGDGIDGMFNNAREFNQPLSNWFTGHLYSIRDTFKNAVSFDQSLASWNVRNFTYNIDLTDTAMSELTLSNTLVGWSRQNLNSIGQLDIRGMSVNSAGLTAIDTLRSKGWTVYYP